MENLCDIKLILKDFYIITGARISLHDMEFNEIAAYPDNVLSFCYEIQKNEQIKKECIRADINALKTVEKTKRLYRYKCHCGLTEIVAPIFHYGIISGYVMMGQIFEGASLDISELQKYTFKYKTDSDNKKLCKNIPCISDKFLNSYINILNIISVYLTQAHTLRPDKSDLANEIKSYIEQHYFETISINSLCSHFECSRATLINGFKEKYNCTVMSYVNQFRLKNAAERIINTSDSIKDISISVGFYDQNYFSKIFSKHYGICPSEYRQKNKPVVK